MDVAGMDKKQQAGINKAVYLVKTLILAYVEFWTDAILHFTIPGSLRICTVLRHVEDVGIALTNKIQSNVKSGKEKACVQVHRDGKITWRNSVQRLVAIVNPMKIRG